ncbi:hypothetical protein ABT008_09855 [Micromonospora sp. NPDC002389]|uniref:hypothetical protein n=1 Tax=Micromonospora sp. NPDC002389 TaxID=3154272 RepID=UPI003323270A
MLYAQCETTQVTAEGKGAALFGYTSLCGSVPGGQAEYLRGGPHSVSGRHAPVSRRTGRP